MPLDRFGEGTDQYDFSAASVVLGALEDNFKQVAEQITAIPGMAGAFSSYGRQTPPSVAGEVRQQMTLVSQTLTGMDTLRDNLNAMQDWGVQPLVKRLSNYPTDLERVCYGYVQSIRYTDEDAGTARTKFHQAAEILWRVLDPRWYAVPDSGALWGEVWGGAWQGPRNTISASGVLTDTAITYNGKTPVEVRAFVKTGAGQTCQNPTLQRVRNAKVVEQVSYTATLGAGQTLEIDAHRHAVSLNGANAYTSLFAATRRGWLTLVPGSNTIRVTFANSGDAASVELYYYDAYR